MNCVRPQRGQGLVTPAGAQQGQVVPQAALADIRVVLPGGSMDIAFGPAFDPPVSTCGQAPRKKRAPLQAPLQEASAFDPGRQPESIAEALDAGRQPESIAEAPPGDEEAQAVDDNVNVDDNDTDNANSESTSSEEDIGDDDKDNCRGQDSSQDVKGNGKDSCQDCRQGRDVDGSPLSPDEMPLLALMNDANAAGINIS